MCMSTLSISGKSLDTVFLGCVQARKVLVVKYTAHQQMHLVHGKETRTMWVLKSHENEEGACIESDVCHSV